MKMFPAIAAFLLTLSACFLEPRTPVASRGSHALHAPEKLGGDDPHPYPALTAGAPMQRLLDTVDGAIQAEEHLDRMRMATALEAIADAMESFARHDPQPIEAIRANVAALRKPVKTRRQAELVRDSLDKALEALRTHESARTFDDIERASGRIESVSPTLALTRQTMALRDALCAVGNAVSARARLASLRCINSRRAMADSPPENLPWQAANTPQ